MKKEEYDKLQLVELKKNYWWHIGRRFILIKFLKRWFPISNTKSLILDFGCGTGENFEILSKFGQVIGIDNSEVAVKFCQQKGHLAKLINGNNLPFPDKSIDFITVLDVLEHLDNDVDIFMEYKRVLKESGRILITVPAYKFLWSEHDKAMKHRRRYIASELQTKLNQSGFKILKMNYIFTFVFPLVLFYRIFRRIFPKKSYQSKVSYVILPKFINQFFVRIMQIETFLVDKINLPFGSSIIIVAEKK